MVKVMRGQGINDDNTAAAGTTLQLVGEEEGREKSNLPYDYNPQVLQSYFSARPMLVLKRVVQVVTTLGGYTFNVGMDKFLRRSLYDTNLEVQRASELRNVITSLGPFYIKLGQALSIRPDILSPRTMYELQKLCDKVPSYDSKIAFATMERELGKPVREVFSEITPEPVAAASLGQVYKATLRSNGKIVAVKVQRPGVLETVSLDLYLARELGSFARIFPGLVNRIDPIALLDEFAYRFFNELDYNKECDNGIKIKEHMKVLPMVVIPDNFPELTSRRVHVAEWIEGEKLSQSTADDVGALVNLGVITYLSQLLDSGFFHAE
jgi:aarF domain-containing kinase